MVQPLWKTGWRFLIKLNLCLLYNLANLSLGTQERKTCSQNSFANVQSSFIYDRKKMESAQMFFSRGMGKLGFIYAVEYCLVIERIEPLDLHNSLNESYLKHYAE